MYCTRTVPEMEKVLAELQELCDYRAKYFLGAGQQIPQILALGLSSRKNLCIHPSVAGEPCSRPRQAPTCTQLPLDALQSAWQPCPCCVLQRPPACSLPCQPSRMSARSPRRVHPGTPSLQRLAVADEGSRESVDAKCRRLTATWVREKATSDPDVETCSFNEGLDAAGTPCTAGAGLLQHALPCMPSHPP